jgi:protein phosphatase
LTTIYFTNTGTGRDRNEDAVLAGPVHSGLSMPGPKVAVRPGPLSAVADGIGGGPGGALAARVALEDLGLMAGSRPLPRREDLVECLHGTAARLGGMARRDPGLSGMGAAVAGLWRHGHSGLAFNCGDCRVYRLRGRDISLLTRDHSVPFAEYLEGRLPFGGVRGHPERHILTSAVQESNHDFGIFARVVRLMAGDVFLVCSDGVWEGLGEGELTDLLAGHADPGPGAQALAGALLRRAGGDNLSFLLQTV